MFRVIWMIPKKQTHSLEIYVGHPSLQAAMIYTLHAQWIYDPWLLEGWLEHARQQVALTCHNDRSLCIKVGQLVAATSDLSLQHVAATFCLVCTTLSRRENSTPAHKLCFFQSYPMGQCSPSPFFILITYISLGRPHNLNAWNRLMKKCKQSGLRESDASSTS